MSDNKCKACGQWSGRGHKCPTPTTVTPPSELDAAIARHPSNAGRDLVNARVTAAQTTLASVPSGPRVGTPSFDCTCQDCEYVATDCCGEPRPDCETARTRDGEDPQGLTACEEGYGCAPTAEERYAEMARAEDEYWASPAGQAEQERHARNNEDEYTASLAPAVATPPSAPAPVEAKPTPELWDAIRERADALRAEEEEVNKEKDRALNAYRRATTPEARERAHTRIEAAQARLDEISEQGRSGVWIVTKAHNLTPEWQIKAWENVARDLPGEHGDRARAIAARLTAEANA